MTFKPGDRVAFYGTGGEGGRRTGEVLKDSPSPAPSWAIVIKADEGDFVFQVHPKTCRKLRKKAKTDEPA